MRLLHLYWVTNRFKSQLHFLHVLKDAKPEARRALLACGDKLIKATVECATNTLNGNHKLTKNGNSKLKKYNKNHLGMLVTKISFKSKRKLLVQKDGFTVPLLASALSGVIGTHVVYYRLTTDR